MQYATIIRILGILLSVFSLSMIPPAIVAEFFQDSPAFPFMMGFFVTLVTGLVCFVLCRDAHAELKVRDGFLIVVLFWVVLCLFAGLPFMISPQPHETITDAIFESVSGLTTTGASIVLNVDALPSAMRYYRQQLQLFGGMGIIVLAVAILPMLGVGGMQLYRAETPGPIKDHKLTPRITETAKRLWYIYVGLTLACALCYYFAGMSTFDAVGESFATVSTGGFSMHTGSFSYYNNNTIELIASLFMVLGATNFSLHFLALQNKALSTYFSDEEFNAFIKILLFLCALVIITLLYYRIGLHFSTTITKSIFNTISILTTTGLVSAPFYQWPTLIPILLMMAALMGGCASSTSGGMKVIRILLLKKQSAREIQRLIHPKAIITLKFGQQVMPEYILQAMWGFIAVFIGLFAVIILILLTTGLDLTTSFGSAVAALANAGVSIGNTANGFQNLTITAKWTLIFAMLAGRLEIFTLLVLFTPTFWRS